MTGNVDLTLLQRRLAELAALDEIADSQADATAIYGDGGGSGGGMEARVAKIEATVEHIEKDISEIKGDIRGLRDDAKSDFRVLFGAGIVATVALAALMAHGFHWL
jgi:hypothetical protein